MADDLGADALSHPLEFPPEFKQWLVDYVAQSVPKMPISQVFGYQLQRVRTATTDAGESTASTSYVNLSTVGPTLSNLANGFYILVFGADCAQTSGTAICYMAPSINGAAAADDDSAANLPIYPSSARTGAFRALMVQLNSVGGVNEIIMKYRASAGTALFEMRYLHAIKVLSLDE